MSITYPVTWPTSPAPAEMELAIRTVSGVNVSPYTLAQEAYEWPGVQVLASVRYAPRMARADADPIIAAGASLFGRMGTFLLGPAGTDGTPRGALGGTPVVDGANQEGKTLNIRGCSNSITNWLRKGDWIQLGSGATAHLHMSLKDTNTDGTGKATLDLSPPVGGLRGVPADGATIVTANPVGVFRMPADKMRWTISEAHHRGIVFEAEEAL